MLGLAHHATGLLHLTRTDFVLLLGILIGFVGCFVIEHRK